ncbi:hypothetical protein CBR_g450 [Chara braunii]|uniref:CCHC-type domain-containing protein n=1 Tax=Chara braunii TaxID=69332 RepID=A0A388KBB0_CHABU|nr:hypothetical protein CBR_g450 [Chara braunii]|eukprot:GBG67311.1 hypothetical protein CBR_g450 [Chara braunii]
MGGVSSRKVEVSRASRRPYPVVGARERRLVKMPEEMADGGRKLVTLNDLIDALDKRERAPSNVPKVETFHFMGDRVSDWLDLTEQALVGLLDEVKLQRVLSQGGGQGYGRARFDWRNATCWHCGEVGHIVRFCQQRPDDELAGLISTCMDGDIYDRWGKHIDPKTSGGIRQEALRRAAAGPPTAPAMFRIWQKRQDPGVRVEEIVGENEEVTQQLKARTIKEVPIVVESDDEAQEVVRELASTILERMEDLLTKVGRYQERLRAMCEKAWEWEMSLPQVMLYGSGPKSSSGPQGCPSVATAGAGPRSGMTFRPPTSHGRVLQAVQTRGQSKATTSQGPSQAPSRAPSRKDPEPERRKEVVEVQEEEDEGDDEEDERLRQEEDRRAEQRAKKRGAQGGAEPSLHDGVPKRKRYAVRLEEGFDVERIVDKLLEGHNDLMNLKDILASAPRLRGELKGRLSRRHEGTMILALSDPACGNYEIIKCRNTGPGSARNRLNLGSFTFEESEYARRRLWEKQEEEGLGEVLSLSLNDVNKAMEVVAAHDMEDPEAIKSLREQALLIWTRQAERQVAKQVRERAQDWEDCQAQLRRAFGRPQHERHEPRVERRRRSKRPREPTPREVGLARERRRAPTRQGDELAGPALAEESFPACGLRAVEFRRITSEELRSPPPLPSTQEMDIPRETPFRSLATHLDVSQWEASRLGEGSVEPACYVPLEELLDPEMETDMRDRGEPQDPEVAAERPDPLVEERARTRSQAREVEWERRFREMVAAVDRLSAAWEASQAGRAGADGHDRGMRASPSQRAAVEVPRQAEPVEEMPLDTAGEEGGAQESLMAMSTERRGSRLHELAAAMGIGTPQERPQRLDAPEQASRLGELRADLGSWATGTDSGGSDSWQQQQQEVMSEPTTMVSPQPSGSCGDEVVVGTERAHEEGPRESGTPDCRPTSTAVREGEDAEAMVPGPHGHMGLPSCQGVTTETMEMPPTSSSRGRKKKTAWWHDTSCFWCKEGHRVVDCSELLEDKAEGRVAEVDGKLYDKQGRIVERAPDGGRAQLYRQN